MTPLPVMSPLVALPIAAALILAVLVHARATYRSREPEVRKRIRIANACLMMLTLPLVAAGFSLIDPRTHPRAWALTWIAAIALLLLNIALAFADVIHTLRLLRVARRELRSELTRSARTDADHSAAATSSNRARDQP